MTPSVLPEPSYRNHMVQRQVVGSYYRDYGLMTYSTIQCTNLVIRNYCKAVGFRLVTLQAGPER